jgi:hypothetical protein
MWCWFRSGFVAFDDGFVPVSLRLMMVSFGDGFVSFVMVSFGDGFV